MDRDDDAKRRNVDPKTGEVHESDERPRRRWRVLTDEQRAERDQVRAERAELRRAELATLRAIDPACDTEDDPPVVWRAPKRMGGEPNGVLLDAPRLSGRGRPGSRLVLAAREYDGAGPNGGNARRYVTAFIRYRDGAAYERRSIGVAFHRSELRDVAEALLREAARIDNLDAREAASLRGGAAR